MSENNTNKNISHHILPTAANLLGICFVILSLMKVMRIGMESVVDEMVSAAIVIFLIASILSYVSIRSAQRADAFEKFADILFLAGLGLLTVTSVIIVFEII